MKCSDFKRTQLDSVNEFATRIMDGSDTTSEALQMAGLNADEIVAKFKQGGPEAASAFQEVTQAIGDIGDASIQEQAAVGLFGSMAEDVGVDAVLALGNVEGAADQTGDTLNEINQIKYSTIGEAIQGIWRMFQTNLLLPLQSILMPYINTFVTKARDAFARFSDVFSALEPLGQYFLGIVSDGDYMNDWITHLPESIQGPVQQIGEKFAEIRDKAINAFQSLKEFATPILQEVINFIMQQVQKLVSFWNENGQQIITAVGNAFTFISNIVQTVMPFVLSIIRTVWNSIKNVINGALGVIMGAVNIFTGLFTGNFSKMWEGVKQLFFGAIELIWGWINLSFFGRIIKGVKGFITGFGGGIRSLWQGVVQLFRGGVTSAWNLIRTGWTSISNATTTVFSGIWNFLKNTWNSIRSIFSGTINFIRNIVSTGWNFVSNLTRTVFGGIWNFLRTIGTNIWNFIKNVVSNLVSGFRNGWSNISNTTQEFFSAIWIFLRTIWMRIANFIKDIVMNLIRRFRNGWQNIYNTTKNIFTNIRDFLRNIWNTVYNFIRNTIQNIFDRIRNTWNNTYDTTKNIFTNIWNFLRRTWRNIYNGIRDSVSNIFNRVRNTWNNLWDKTKEIFGNIYDGIKGTFDDIISAAKKLPGRIKDAFTNVANTMVEWLGKGVNGVIGGINWVMGELEIDYKLPEWNVPQFAHGTDGHPGGPMIVGDGKGSNSGSELITTPDGKQYLSPDKPTLTVAPKGTHVLSAKRTKQLLDPPRYAFGTIKDGIQTGWNKFTSGVKNVGQNIKDGVTTAWEYVQEPAKLLDIALEFIGVELPSEDSTIGKIAIGGFNLVKDKAVDFIKDKIDGFFENIKNVGGSGVQRWAGVATTALKMTNQYSKSNLERLLYQMQTESGGNPKAINLWDSNAKRGTPSKGLMQVIDPTFQSYKMPGYNDIWNPLDNILASIRYAVSRYGSLSKAYRGVGYEKGGFIDREHLAMLGEGDKDEVVIPLEQHRSRAVGLWQEAGRRLGISGQTMAVLYNSQDEVVKNLKQLANILAVQTQEIVNQNPLLNRIVSSVNQTRNALTTQIKATAQSLLMRINQTEEALSVKVDEKGNEIIQVAQNAAESLGNKIEETNKLAKRAHEMASKAANEAVGKAKKELIASLPEDSFERNSLESKNRGKPGYVQAEDGSWVHKESFYGNSTKNSNVPESLRKRIASLIAKRGKSALNYFRAIEEDGDWLNDWAHTGDRKADKEYQLAGYEYAQALGFEEGKYAQKHLERIKGYDSGGIVDTKQLAWVAEGGWAEAIISHDPAKRARSHSIWRETGEELGFIGDDGSEIVELLKRLLRKEKPNVHMENHFTPSESTPYESTKRMNKMLRDLGLEWGG